MKKKTKVWLLTAVLLVVLGLILFAAGMTANNWNFLNLSTEKYETNAYEIREAFRNIAVETNTADILFAVSQDGKCKVVCYEAENEKHAALVQDGTLMIRVAHQKPWYDYIGITMETPKITVYLPQTQYDSLIIKETTGDLEIPGEFRFESMDISTSTGDVKNYASTSGTMKIKTTTGAIYVENISAEFVDLLVSTGDVTAKSVTCNGDVQIGVSTGRVKLTDVKCKNMTSRGNTGDAFLENVIASEVVFIERSTGDVKMEDCDAAEIQIQTDTGDVAGTLLSEKVFLVETNTGDVDVPKTTVGGKCEITTNTGDIRVKIAG